MMVGQGFLSGSPSFSLYYVDYPDCTATVALRSERSLALSHTPARSQKKRPFFFFVCFSFSFLLFLSLPPPHPFSLSSSFYAAHCHLVSYTATQPTLLFNLFVCVRAIRPFSLVITCTLYSFSFLSPSSSSPPPPPPNHGSFSMLGRRCISSCTNSLLNREHWEWWWSLDKTTWICCQTRVRLWSRYYYNNNKQSIYLILSY